MDLVRNLLRAVAPYADGDLSDRFNYSYSTTVLVILSAFITGWSFVGTPIQCWFPAYYKGWWIEYALDYCFVQNTYFLPFTEIKPSNYFDIAEHIIPIPKNITEREEKLIGYYQWVPFILALQAILFYLPVVLWRTIYTCNGLSLSILTPVKFFFALTLSNLCFQFVKFLYALNALVQFVILRKFLGVESLWWGSDVLGDIIQGKEWPETGHFPRVTLCDFTVRVLGNLHRHTVQCVLMINMFNEKIFIFVWFWLLLSAFFSVHSFFYWLLTSLTTFTGRRMVTNYLQKIDPAVTRSQRRKMLVDEFISENLRPDGLFLVRLIQINSGDLVTYELVKTLWQRFIAARNEPPNYSEATLLSKKPLVESGF